MITESFNAFVQTRFFEVTFIVPEDYLYTRYLQISGQDLNVDET